MSGKPHSIEEIEKSIELYNAGMNIREVSIALNIPYGTVHTWIGQKRITDSPGHNADRHLCRVCKYRMNSGERQKLGGRCDYIEITGHSRKCSVEECDKFERGRRIKRDSKLHVSLSQEVEK